MNNSPFIELNNYDKETLLDNKYSLTQIEGGIAKLLQCLDYNDPVDLAQINRILAHCEPLSLIQSLKLLSGEFLCDSIRKYAVMSLEQASYTDIQEHLIQIVQALKYEIYHDSYLAQFILKLAIKHPLNLGNL